MTVPSIAAAASRVGQIQAQFARIEPRHSFAATLEAATGAEDDQEFVVAPQAQESTAIRDTGSVPVGILGTPIMLRPGAVVDTYIGSNGNWVDALPATGREWAAAIQRAASDAGLDPRLLAAMVWQESGFNPEAISGSGAIGLAQLMPATADGLGVDPHDPIQNLGGGARYLAWTIQEFGSVELGLAAYNAGPGNVRAANGIPDIPETQAYVPRVLEYYRILGGEG